MTLGGESIYFGIECSVYEFLKAEIKIREEQGLLSFEKRKDTDKNEYNPNDNYEILKEKIRKRKLVLINKLEEIFCSSGDYDLSYFQYNFKKTKIMQKYNNIELGYIPSCYYGGKIIIGVLSAEFMITAKEDCPRKHEHFPELVDNLSEETKKQVIKDILEIFPNKDEYDFNYFQIPGDCTCCS